MAKGITKVKELGGITEYRLEKNGLRILLVPDSSVPVAGCMVTYNVGSRNEAVGYTGSAHLLEHLVFKGTSKFNPEKGTSMDKLLESKGAAMNASTSFDRTNYYQVLASDQLPLAIEIEGDRMRTARFLESDRASEMPVVRNEYEMYENDPASSLDKEVWGAAFMAHPYHHPIIGWKSDIEGVSIERLKQFYDDFYWPNNATVSVAGSFDEEQVLVLLEKYFGVHSTAPHVIPAVYTEEPKQEGPRRVQIQRAGNQVVSVSHKIPNALHADIPALLMLASVLYEDKTSRLYKAFVDSALATDVAVYCNQLHDQSLFQTSITLAPRTTHAKAEQILLKEYARLADDGITTAELTAAKRSARVYASRRKDGVYALLSALNEEIAMGDWTRFITLHEDLEKVTRNDVQRVAQKYFAIDQSTTGWSVNAPQKVSAKTKASAKPTKQ
ncbi:MAG: peptidase domain protein [Parcubacteria group bacterium]|nr:peptidase domain protein [Parcubacteria group bacterium]